MGVAERALSVATAAQATADAAMGRFPKNNQVNVEEGHVHRQIDGQGFLAWDSFNRTDSSTIGESDSGHLWTETEGDWEIASNICRVVTVGTDTLLTMDVGSQDVGQIVITFTSAAADANIDAGVVFRMVDSDNLLMVRARGGATDAIELHKKISGSYSLLISDGWVNVAATIYQLHVYWDGPFVRGYVTSDDGVPLSGFTYDTPSDTYTPFLGATRLGLRHDTSSGSGDSFRAFSARLGNAVATSQVVRTHTINFIIDGGGSAITTGEKGPLVVDFACEIEAWTILGDQIGSIVVDIWKDTYANYPPTVADTITGSEKPTLSSAAKNRDASLTTWTIAIEAGDILIYNVDSAATVTRVTVALKVRRTG